MEIKYEESVTVQGGGSSVGTLLDAKHAQSFPVDTYFHYQAGQTPNHPPFDEFRGYPKKVYVYRDANCVKGLALEFEWSGSDIQKIFIAGDETSAADLVEEPMEFQNRVTNIGASFDNAGNGNCLTAIGFTLVMDAILTYFFTL